jgi:type II secretory pathway pseudopilin PulG
MSSSKKPLKIVQKLIRQVWQMSRTITKKLMSFLLRGLLVFGRRSRSSPAGFILPTVVMVLLVVGLLTTAIVMRSFDRTKNVSNVRVNQRVLAATAPAIDRAEAKIEALLADPRLPRSTPTDQALYNVMTGNLPKFTLGDETPLQLVNDLDGDGFEPPGAGTSLDDNEALKTAWRFPVDTDNNGKFDSYSLYGVYFRNPSQAVGANRARTPLEARTPPMDNGSANGCAAGANTSASLVGSSGWYKTSDGNLKKSFYVFAATVPIINPPPDDADGRSFEAYKGNKGFAALEYQQDQARIPLTNNAVVYDDDLEITPGAGIKLNGRIMTNSNLFIGQSTGTCSLLPSQQQKVLLLHGRQRQDDCGR